MIWGSQYGRVFNSCFLLSTKVSLPVIHSGHFGGKKVLSLPWIESTFPGCPARRLIAIWTDALLLKQPSNIRKFSYTVVYVAWRQTVKRKRQLNSKFAFPNTVISNGKHEMWEYFDGVMSLLVLNSVTPWNRRRSEPSLTTDDFTSASRVE